MDRQRRPSDRLRVRSRFRPAGPANPRSAAPRRDRRRRLRFPGRPAPVPATAAPGRRRAGRGRTGRSRRGAGAVAGLPCRRPRAEAGRQRFGRRDAIDPTPIEDGGHREFVAEGDIEGLAALEAKFGPLQRPDRRGRGVRRGARGCSALACSASAGRAWARPAAGHIGARAAAPNPAISSRRSSGNLGLAIGPMRTIFCCICPSCDALPRCCQKGPFFCCGGVGSCYKPAARGIAAGYGCFSRGRGGTGRRAGFRFQ